MSAATRSEERRVGKECRRREAPDQAEDGIRDHCVTGVQTCALPIWPYLDGIDWEIVKDNTTRNLAFIAGKSDIASPYGMTVPLLNDVMAQAPQAICELTSTNVSRNQIGRASCRERM